MELTNEILEKNGFTCNHPERLWRKYHLSGKNPEFKITAEQDYVPHTNVLGYSITCTRSNDHGVVKTSKVSVISSVEDLQDCINLCDIKVNIVAE